MTCGKCVFRRDTCAAIDGRKKIGRARTIELSIRPILWRILRRYTVTISEDDTAVYLEPLVASISRKLLVFYIFIEIAGFSFLMPCCFLFHWNLIAIALFSAHCELSFNRSVRSNGEKRLSYFLRGTLKPVPRYSLIWFICRESVGANLPSAGNCRRRFTCVKRTRMSAMKSVILREDNTGASLLIG